MLKNNPLLGNFTGNFDRVQARANIPAELAVQKRFFACVSKSDVPTGWNKPENQKLLADIETDKFAGFDIAGHDIADRADYLCFDFDHVLKLDGSFVNESVRAFVAELREKFPNAYIERSISGTGLHVFFKPTADALPKITNGSKGVLKFDDSAKLEIFYKTGRYFLITGFKIPGSGSEVPFGDRVDEYIKNLLETIHAQNRPIKKADKPKKDFSDDPPEYTRDLAVALLDYIDPATLLDSDWLSVVSSCKNCGVDETISDAWCSKDFDRYDAMENQRRYDSLTDSNFDIKNLIGKVPTFNISAFKKQWYKDHPEFCKKKYNSDLRDVDNKISNFNKEKTAALALLNQDVMKFDKDSVFADDFLIAAAFAKLYDGKTFSNIKAGIKENKGRLRDWLALVNDKATEISLRHSDLLAQKNKLQSAITTQKFFAQNDIEDFSMAKFASPENYSISDGGIFKVDGEKLIPVCTRPVFLAEKIVYPVIRSDEISFSDETEYKFVLAHKLDGKFRKIKAEKASNIFDARNLVKLADYNLPVTSANARNVVEYLDAFKTENEKILPIKCCVPRCGWYTFKGTDIFIDPRRTFCNGEMALSNICVDFKNKTAKFLTDKGSIDETKILFQNITLSPVANFILGCSVAVPLLKVLGCRNFMIHIFGTTTSGKTTLFKLATSLVGNPDMVGSFNGTKNAITRLAFDRFDYPFFVDEKQSADKNMRDSLLELGYIVGNGQGKLRCNRDGSLQDSLQGRTILLSNGETPFADDNATGGIFTRLLQIQLKDKIFDKSDCEKIWAHIKENHGFILPLVIAEYLKDGFEELRETFKMFKADLAEYAPAISPIHLEFVAVGTTAWFYLCKVLGVDNDEKKLWLDAKQTAKDFLQFVPAVDDISDAKREIDCVTNFITRNQKNFAGLYDPDIIKTFYGTVDEEYLYITLSALKQCCDESGFDHKKLVADLVDAKFFIPKGGADKERAYFPKQVYKALTRCYRIPLALLGINPQTFAVKSQGVTGKS